jgi:hypothetical protein
MWAVLQHVTYKNWILVLVNDSGHYYLQWCFDAPCAITDEKQRWSGRKWQLSPHMVEGELVQTAFAAALQAEEHECREAFKYGEVAPFNPHIDFDRLLSAAKYVKGRNA